MDREFTVRNGWSGRESTVLYRSAMSAVATRHAQSFDIGFEVDGRSLWLRLPLTGWNEYKRLTGKVLEDSLAKEAAALYLRRLISSGEETGASHYQLSVEEFLTAIEDVVAPVGK